MKKNKIIGSILSICLLILLVGFSYAFFTYNKTGLYTHTITGGKMAIIYNETTGNNITINNAYPLTDTEALTQGLEFEFTITGYNESDKNIYYGIEMDYGEDLSYKERFKDTDLKLSLFENDEVIFENEIFANLDNQNIHYGYINQGTSSETPVTNNYKLRIWINDDVLITDTPENADITDKSVYSSTEFANRYANFKVNVKADLTYDDVGYITYDANGGSFIPAKTSLTTGRVTMQKPVMVNKGFLGWSSTPNGEVEYKSGDAYTGTGEILYAVYGDTRNVMNTFPSTIASQKSYITEVYFIYDAKENIDVRYDAAAIKADLTYNNQGKVLGWLENDYYDETNGKQYYKLYVGSEGTTYLNTGENLFNKWNTVTAINFANVDTSMVTNMSKMLAGDYYNRMVFNELDLSNFNTSKVTDMSGMFEWCESMIGLNLSNFDTINVTNFNNMFCGCESLVVLDLSSFNTSNAKNMNGMFQTINGDMSLINLDLSNFDTSNVTDMAGMFYGCKNLLNINISNFDTSKVTDMSGMFYGCVVLLELDVSNFDTINVTNMSGMFENCSSLTNLDLSRFDTSKVANMSSMFYGCINIKSIGSNKKYDLNIENFDTSNVTNMWMMFQDCSSVVNIDLSNFNTSQVTNISSMFRNNKNLITLNLNNWNTSKVTDMSWMFYGCESLVVLDLSNLDTSEVTDMEYMFDGCSVLNSLDVSNFNTSKVTTMYSMFWGCNSLISLDLSSFDINSLKNVKYMFRGCKNLVYLDISNFYLSENNTILTTYDSMFYYEMPETAKVMVRDAEAQSWILNNTNYFFRPGAWTTDNVIVKTA